jgi:CTP-dependent riboflavin kinase
MPQEWAEILDYMKKYPNFSFSSSRLSKVFSVSSQRISKILLAMSDVDYVERRSRGNNKKKVFYKWKRGPEI